MDIVIIGGGASGLIAAITASNKVSIILTQRTENCIKHTSVMMGMQIWNATIRTMIRMTIPILMIM